ncbi:hypothetical protein FHS76_004240 [Ochrobactrum daejeonense]|uniref:Uncharacterized protein n=1 Tax=Brucella daejeonensis TaxID=659015 RepID=A0A7W9ENA0_9HYPH|nr:hypothetical protein [Brucella daejeonensis]MBB5704323.1 hypothetical protein [Brucella daejeonensis]
MTPKEEIIKFIDDLPTMVSELVIPQVCLAFGRMLPYDDNDYRAEFIKIFDEMSEDDNGPMACAAIIGILDLVLFRDADFDLVKFNEQMFEKTKNTMFRDKALQEPLLERQFSNAREKLQELRSSSLSTEALHKWKSLLAVEFGKRLKASM